MNLITSIYEEIYINKNLRTNKTAIVFENKKIDYNTLKNNVDNLSSSLISEGIKINQKIGIVMPNSIELVYCMLAASKIGLTIIPFNTNYNKDVLLKCFRDLKVDTIIAWHRFIEYFDVELKKYKNKIRLVSYGKKLNGFLYFEYLLLKKNSKKIRNPNLIYKDYIISLTSGSTGKPKPILFKQTTKLERAKAAIKTFELNQNDVIITSTPLDHSLGQRLLFTSLILGATCVLLKKFTTNNWLDSVRLNNVSFTILISSQIENIFKNNINQVLKLKSLKKIVSASSKFKDDFKKNKKILKQFNLYEMYGASEIGTATSINLNKEKNKYNSVGRSCSNIEIKILKDGKITKKNIIGEIVCKTPLKFFGYYNNENLTKKTFYKNYFKTGDMGYLDENNYLYFTGRLKNIMNISGVNVFPEDIEAVIKSNNKILECCITSNEDEFGEKIIAIIHTNDTKKKILNEIKDLCFEKLSDFQIPYYYCFTNEFPKTTIGKLDRQKLVNKISKLKRYI
jgi:acyl-CoA synthetase (AMP-forming)/AMP-acid ligase II